MKQAITIPGAGLSEYQPAHPERTAYKSAVGAMNFDYTIKEWNSRAAMLTTLRMQDKREHRQGDWRMWPVSMKCVRCRQVASDAWETSGVCGEHGSFKTVQVQGAKSDADIAADRLIIRDNAKRGIPDAFNDGNFD
jgi:hypothetical protein